MQPRPKGFSVAKPNPVIDTENNKRLPYVTNGSNFWEISQGIYAIKSKTINNNDE